MDGRTYGDGCGVARALDVVGERWALLVVRELLLGPKRFTDLHRGLGGASQNVLAQRLRELDRAGIVRRRRLGPPAGTSAYELTERGAALEPILVELGRWGRHQPFPDDGSFSVDALMLALKTTFDPAVAGDLETSVDLRLGDDRFEVDVAGGRLSVLRGSAAEPDVTVGTDMATMRELAFGGGRVETAAASGALRVEGDAEALQRMLDAFPAR
jgi:DNA-binding HxlR family transcriptional regulator/putative sterol carrier protein